MRIGTAESLDATHAAAVIGLADRATLRTALSATLAKTDDDRARFERVFDRFFRPDAGGRRGALDRLRAEGLDEDTLRDMERRLELAQQVAGGSGGGGLTALLEGGAELDRRIEAALRAADVGRMINPMQTGIFAMRALDQLGADRMQAQLEAVRDALVETGDERLAELLAVQLEALRRRVRAAVRDDFERRNPDRVARSRRARLDVETFITLDPTELAEVAREVERLGHILRDRMERNRRRSRRGWLDVRATVRSSLRTGGIPFAPVFRRRRRDRPRLVILCDVSDSVRAAARFLLILVYAMQEAFSRTRSFVFVRDVGETTDLFAQHPIEEAVTRAFRGENIVVGASSDYGRSFRCFVERHLDAIDRRTTVLILGDARTNQLPPDVDALRTIQSRAARVIWLNPEPRSSWGLGDSEMPSYRPFCSQVAPVRSLAELRLALTELAATLSR